MWLSRSGLNRAAVGRTKPRRHSASVSVPRCFLGGDAALATGPPPGESPTLEHSDLQPFPRSSRTGERQRARLVARRRKDLPRSVIVERVRAVALLRSRDVQPGMPKCHRLPKVDRSSRLPEPGTGMAGRRRRVGRPPPEHVSDSDPEQRPDDRRARQARCETQQRQVEDLAREEEQGADPSGHPR